MASAFLIPNARRAVVDALVLLRPVSWQRVRRVRRQWRGAVTVDRTINLVANHPIIRARMNFAPNRSFLIVWQAVEHRKRRMKQRFTGCAPVRALPVLAVVEFDGRPDDRVCAGTGIRR